MEKLHKEPGDYTKDSSSFTLELQKFHESRGSPFRHAPRINGREVDLFALYNSVTAIGGWQKVNDLLKWDYVLDKLNFPKACANASLALRQIYVRYLSVFEKVHFLGEDADEEVDPGSESRGGRKSTSSALVQVPMFYNRAQHEIPESQRLAVGLAPSLGGPSDYAKLCLSLLSGLPNEEALSLNVCTLLSNEGRHSLKLDRNPRLLDLLLAQAGLFTPDDPTLRPTLLECWQGVEGRRMERFWEDNLDPETIALFNIGNGSKDEEDELFNLNYEVGTRSIEGQRVLRIALIFHNLSFEERNAVVLARNRTFIRFVMLSALSRWSTLRQVALDTIGNLASKLVLYPAPEEDEDEASLGRCYEDLAGDRQRWSCALLRLTREGVQSQDRYLVVRCLDILARLCRQERNAEPLLAALDGALCRRVFELLTVHDLMLLIYALEALYMLSELGRDACERMLRVHRSMGILVSLLTLDPLAYGPLAQKGMKLIETVDPLLPPPVPVVAPNPATVTPMAAPPPPPPPPTLAPPPATTTTTSLGAVPASVPLTGGAVAAPPPPPQTDPFDTEAFAGTWVRAMYEPAPPGCSVARNDIYAEYVTFCSKAGRKSVISASVFANCVKTVYTQTGIRRVDNANGMVSFHHDGLRKRLNPLPVPIQVTSCLSISTQAAATTLRSPLATGGGGAASSHSPILKAQLSAPLRALTPPANQVSPPPSPALATPVATTPPGGATGGSSNLIKSLLANKVSRNLQRQQQMQQQQTATAASADADATPVTAGTPVLANSATAPRVVPEPVRREVNPASINSHHHHHQHQQQQAAATTAQTFTYSPTVSSATVSTVTATAASPQVSCLTSALQAKLQSQVQAQQASVQAAMRVQPQVQVPTMHQAQIQVQVPTAAVQSQLTPVVTATAQAQRQGLPTTTTMATVHMQQQQVQVQVPTVQTQSQVQMQVPTQQQVQVQVPTMTTAQPQQVQVQVQPQQVQVQVPAAAMQPQQVQVQVPTGTMQPQQVQVQVAGSGIQTQFQQQVQVQASPVVQAQVQPQVQVQVPTQICQATLPTHVQTAAGPMLIQSAQPGTVVQAPAQVVVSMAPTGQVPVSISMPTVSVQTSMPVQTPLQVTFPTTVSTSLSASTQSLVSSLASNMTSSLAAGLAANQTVVVSSSALASSLNSGSNQTVVMGSTLGGNPTVMMGSGLASNPVVAQGTSLAASLASAGGLPPGATIVMVPNSATGITTGMLVVRPQGKLPAGAVNAALLARSQAVANAINAGARGPLIVSTRPNGFQRDFVMEVSMPADCKPTSLEATVQQATATTTVAEPHSAHNHVGENGTASPVVTTAVTAVTHKCGGTVVHPTTTVVSEVAVEGAKSVEGGGVVYKSSPLLNGLLDKGKVPLAMEPTGLQNGSAEDELQQHTDASAEPGGEAVSVVVSNGPCATAKATAAPDLSPIKDIVGSMESASKVISRSNVDAAAGVKRPAAAEAPDGGGGGASCPKRLRLEDSCEATFQAEAAPAATTVPSSGSQTTVVVTRPAELPATTGHQHVLVQHGVIQQSVTTTATTTQQSTTPVTVHHTCTHQTVLQRGPQAPATTATPVVQQQVVTTAAPTVPQPNLVKLLSTTDSGKTLTTASASPVTTAASAVLTTAAPSSTPESTPSAEAKVAPAASKTVGASDGEKKPATAAAHHHHHHHHHHHKAAKLVYNCEWKGCEKTFSTPSAVFYHACNVHIPEAEGDVQCQWDSCDDMKRRRLSLFTHLQDRHCNEQVLQIQAVRRQQISQFGKASLPPPAQPPPHPGYAPDAAFLAIRRHALAYYNHRDASDEKESALARSIRLTSALIIRNLATHSSLARRYLRRYEQQLSTVAMSPLESSRTIAQCLREMDRVSTPD